MSLKVKLCLFLFCFSVPAWSQTHCSADEIDYFSCKIKKSEKIISICGNVADGEINDESWLQYRFGAIGRPELIYPSAKTESLDLFEGIYFSKYGAVLLCFMNKRILYDVSLADRYETPKKVLRPSGEVTVTLSKTKSQNLSCQRVDLAQYFNGFSQLAATLESRQRQRDMLLRFYDQAR